jgi:soluble lytic murein transglycosylase-like protein
MSMRTLLAAGLTLLWLSAPPAWATSEQADGGQQKAAVIPVVPVAQVPELLGPADVERYRRIFALQKDGKWRQADSLIKALDERLLMGHVLFQRYMHPTKYRSRYNELAGWMKHYADHPSARRIYRLALRRKPRAARAPKRPVGREVSGIGEAGVAERAYVSAHKRSKAKRAKVARLKRHIRRHLRRGQVDGAAKHLKTSELKKLFDAVEFDQMRAAIARGYFQRGNIKRAFELASAAAQRSRRHVVEADWYAGLSAWRLDRPAEAGDHFGHLARSAASDRLSAAGAFWAARAHLKARRPERVNPMLAIGAGRPHTFYGQLSVRLLGNPSGLAWHPPALAQKELDRLLEAPPARRAAALAQVGQTYLAERELRRVNTRGDIDLQHALLALAHRLGTPAAELKLARAILDGGGPHIDSALYPLPAWKPSQGFSVDRALVYAFVRQESAFNARAKSFRGARGLMQLMPRTASFVARDRSLRHRNRRKLFAPDFNLELGQMYLRHLMATEGVAHNLVMVAAAYNGGPGNLRKWSRRMKQKEDALLFIESLPSRETRSFVKRVLANFWIYRERLGQDSPSLDQMASGLWPYYLSLDNLVHTAEQTPK